MYTTNYSSTPFGNFSNPQKGAFGFPYSFYVNTNSNALGAMKINTLVSSIK